MNNLISKDNMERQISEMWSAVDNISITDPNRIDAVEQANKAEADLREIFQKQEILRNAAPEMYAALNLAIEYEKRMREKSTPALPEGLYKIIKDAICLAEGKIKII
jgi:hypothetical protein